MHTFLVGHAISKWEVYSSIFPMKEKADLVPDYLISIAWGQTKRTILHQAT